MRRLPLMIVCLAVLSSVAVAQGKIESKWHCQKPAEEKSVDVSDVAGHKYALAQGTCAATSGSSGEKSGMYTEFQEMWKSSFSSRGRFNVTLDDGDNVYYTYEAKGDPVKKTVHENWKIVGGTGKQKGAKGSGTCSGKLNDDGTSDWECTGRSAAAK